MNLQEGRRWSLLRRLALWYGLSFVVLLAGSNAFLYYRLVAGLNAERNSLLTDRIDAVTALLLSPAHGAEELHRRVEEEWPKRGGERVYVKIYDGNHKLITGTPDAPEGFSDQLTGLAEARDTQRPIRLQGLGKFDYLARLKVMQNSLHFQNPVLIFAAVSDEQSQGFLATYRGTALLTALLSLALSMAVAWQIARAGIRPLQAISAAVRRIGSKTLHERIDLAGMPVELHGLATTFNETLDRLQESFDRLSRFSADIAHELRTPLTNLSGELEIALTKGRSEEEYRDVLSSSLEECEKLSRMIESLLFLARAENLRHELKREQIDVTSEIEALFEFFEPSATEEGLALTFSPCKEGLTALADRILFQRVFGNLISNAIQYTAKGGKIEVSCYKEEAAARIQVRDSGQGIPAEHLGRIFDRFYRVDPSRNVKSGGFGLGLAIVKSIVELHGGKVRVMSEVGKGTSIEVDWPSTLPGMRLPMEDRLHDGI